MSTFFNRALNFLGLADGEIKEGDSYDSNENSTLNYEDYKHLYKEEPVKVKKEKNRKNRSYSGRYGNLRAIDGKDNNKKNRVTVTEPHSFEDVQVIGDDLKIGIPVVINLQYTNNDLSKRIIDFCSGLTYAIEGSIKKVADKVFLTTPRNIVVTTGEEEIDSKEKFYNQL